jgi:hypothetical protein
MVPLAHSSSVLFSVWESSVAFPFHAYVQVFRDLHAEAD